MNMCVCEVVVILPSYCILSEMCRFVLFYFVLYYSILFYFISLQYVGDDDVIIINNFTSIIIVDFHFDLVIVTSLIVSFLAQVKISISNISIFFISLQFSFLSFLLFSSLFFSFLPIFFFCSLCISISHQLLFSLFHSYSISVFSS